MDKQLNTTGLILCTCEGKIPTHIDLEAIEALLKKKKIQVVRANKLCVDWTPLENLASQSKLAGLVIGACSDEIFLSNLRERLNQAGVDEFSTSTLDLLGQSLLDLDRKANTHLAALLLEGLLEKVKRYPGASSENLKPYWFRSGEKMSRRQIFSIPKIRYNLVPTVEKQKCLAWKGCYLCFAGCPKQALVKEGDRVSIDKDLCTGCGACIAPCPTGCIVYPGYTFLELEAQLEALLGSTSGLYPEFAGRAPVIAFVCSPSQGIFQEFLREHSALAPDIIPVNIPCLALASPYLIIKALSLGASSVLLLSCKSGCQKGIEPGKIEENAQMAQGLVEALGIKDKIVSYVAQDDINSMAAGIENIVKGAKTSSFPVLSRNYGETGGKLGSILAVLSSELGKKGTQDLNGLKVPLGRVKIDTNICSFCELCTAHCPTGALRLEESEGSSRILFNYRDCVACNLCLRTCPERKKGAIKVERELDWDALSSKSGETLVETKQICCSKCGAPIGTSLMIDRIRKRLGPGATTAFDLCSQCRFKVALFRDSDKSGKDSDSS